MHEQIFFNNQIRKISDAQIPALSSAALYGRGVFTTIAINKGKPFLWDLHWKRLVHNAEKIGIELKEFSENAIRQQLLELIAANKFQNGRARLSFFDIGSSDLWKYESDKNAALLMTTGERKILPQGGLRLTVSPFKINSTSPLAGVKSCNYLENLLALENAKSRGFDEAVRLNERGEVATAVMSNIFWRRGEEIFTPALSTGALAGTTREFAIDLARSLGFEIAETAVSLTELQRAEEIFLTSAGLGICVVKSFDGKTLQENFTRRLQHAFGR